MPAGNGVFQTRRKCFTISDYCYSQEELVGVMKGLEAELLVETVPAERCLLQMRLERCKGIMKQHEAGELVGAPKGLRLG